MVKISYNIYDSFSNIIVFIKIIWCEIIMDLIFIQNLYNALMTTFLLGSAAILFYISKKGFKSHNTYGGLSTFITALILTGFAIYNSLFKLFEWPFYAFIVIWTGILLGVYIGFWLIVKNAETSPKPNIDNKVQKTQHQYSLQIDDPEESRPKNDNKKSHIPMIDKIFYKFEISLNQETKRKAFHLAGLLLLISYYGIGFGAISTIVNNAIVRYYILGPGSTDYEKSWGPVSNYPYGLNDIRVPPEITIFALWATLILVLIPDIIRVAVGPKYSLFNRVTKSVLRGKEYNAAGPQVFLVTGVITSFFFAKMGLVSYNVSIASSVIACFSDALAALIGRNWGKHKVITISGDKKSVEGFIAGAGSAFLFALIWVNPIYAVIMAIVFFLLDYFTVPIADNLLNPILLTLVIYLVSFVI
ncbi:MAG: hypothetical protein ACTSVV_13245 [Promethearchaeota archaeon]